MAVEIVLFNDIDKLEKSDEVLDILSNETQELIDILISTSIKFGGYGLAAPQIGINKQLFVYRKSINATEDTYNVVINPKIIVSSGKLKSKEEGCLSLPGVRKDVIRSKTFIITSFDRKGEKQRIKGRTKLETIILQHEFDHLLGKTLLNH